jgi:phosphoglucosamine mutase
VKAAIADGEARLSGSGRLVIRKSGTEPLIRVMAEGEDEALVAEVVGQICDAVKAAA